MGKVTTLQRRLPTAISRLSSFRHCLGIGAEGNDQTDYGHRSKRNSHAFGLGQHYRFCTLSKRGNYYSASLGLALGGRCSRLGRTLVYSAGRLPRTQAYSLEDALSYVEHWIHPRGNTIAAHLWHSGWPPAPARGRSVSSGVSPSLRLLLLMLLLDHLWYTAASCTAPEHLTHVNLGFQRWTRK